MDKQKNGLDSFIEKIETMSDSIVGNVYNELLVNKIESLNFMKSLIDSSFIKWLQNFGKGWFKQVFIFFGYLSIIFGFVSLFTSIINLTQIIGSILFMISGITRVLISLVSVILGIGMIKFKKRYPFVVLIQGLLNLFLMFITYFIYSNSYYANFVGYRGIGDLLVSLIFSLIIFIIFFALVLKNKELFSGKKMVEKDLKTKSKNEL